MDPVRAIARTRRGCQINALRPIKLAIQVSRLDRSVYQFHARTHARHDTHTTRTFQHTHTTHTLYHTHWAIYIRDSCYYKKFRGFHTPQAPRVLVHIIHPVDLARPDRTHLVAVHFEGAYRLPLFLREAILMLAPDHETFPTLNPIVPYYLYLCVLPFSLVQFILYQF